MLPLEGMITVAEAARRLGRSLEQVRRYLREGKLKGQRIGGQWFIDERSLEARYQPSGQRAQRIREPTAVMETGKMTKEEIAALFRRIDEHREAIRRRLGRDLAVDPVEILREDRESH
jgi:excisionase family DNA binding protein